LPDDLCAAEMSKRGMNSTRFKNNKPEVADGKNEAIHIALYLRHTSG